MTSKKETNVSASLEKRILKTVDEYIENSKKTDQKDTNIRIFPDTAIVELEPVWPEGLKQEQFDKAIEFLQDNSIILAKTVNEVAHSRYPETKAESWQGNMNLGSVSLTVNNHLRETYTRDDETTHAYGIVDIGVNMNYNEERLQVMRGFAELDEKRCRELFAPDNDEGGDAK